MSRSVSLLVCGIALLVVGCSSADDGATSTAADCSPADPRAVEAIASGLIVNGDGGLAGAMSVPTPAGFEGFAQIIAARITGPGLTDTVGVWATGATGGPIFALDAYAREFSDWGAAAQPGSEADDLRSSLAATPEADQARDCVG